MWFLVIKRVHFSQLKLVAKNDHNDHHVNGRFQEKFDPHGRHWSSLVAGPPPIYLGDDKYTMRQFQATWKNGKNQFFDF